MGFWFFMIFMIMLTPLFMIIFGKSFVNNPPTTINHAYGYRTKMSMKNIDTWKFAHKHFGKTWSKFGIILIIISIIPMLFVLHKSTDIIGYCGGIIVTVQVITLLVSIIPTEIALKKEFDENGNKKI